MGIRFRKSVKMGPVRVNFSKSGIGASVGVKGARITKKANGNLMTTASIPGTGLSYVKETSKKKKTTKSRPSELKTIIEAKNMELKTVNYTTYKDERYPEDKIKKPGIKTFIYCGLILLGGLFMKMADIPLFWLYAILALWCYFHANTVYKKPFEELIQPNSYENYEPIFSDVSGVKAEALDYILSYFYQNNKTPFNLHDLNTYFNSSISKYALDGLYDLGYLEKPERGKYSFVEGKLKTNYDTFCVLCDIKNREIKERNDKLFKKKMKSV